MNSLIEFITPKITKAKDNNLYRNPINTIRNRDIYIQRGGLDLVSFCCNDYLGMASNEEVIEASIKATKEYGMGAASSRYITGNNPLYQELEDRLANFKNTEDAMVFGSGYLANIGTIPALMSRPDIIIADKLIHACMIDGAILSGAKFLRFRHNDLAHLEELLIKHRDEYRNCLILTETIFSMDGDSSPLVKIVDLCVKYDSWLMSDDAHGLGIIKHKIDSNIPYIQMGTLSKSVGTYGGYVCGSKELIEYLRNYSRSGIYNTALPPSVLSASIKSLDIISKNPELGDIVIKKANLFTDVLNIQEAESAIIPIIIGKSDDAINAAHKIEEEGFLVSAIRPPTVPTNTARLRVTFSVKHKDEQIKELANIMNNLINSYSL